MPHLGLTLFQDNLCCQTLISAPIGQVCPEEINRVCTRLLEDYRRQHGLTAESHLIRVEPNDTKRMGQWYLIMNNKKYPTRKDKEETFRKWLDDRCDFKDCRMKRKLLANFEQMFAENKPIEIHIDNEEDDCFIIFL